MKFLVAVMALMTQVIIYAQVPKIAREGDAFYLFRPDGNKVELIKASASGRMNKFILIPEIKRIFFTKCNALAFESYGSDIFSCAWDGSDRSFLRKEYGDLDTAFYFKYQDKEFVIFQFSVSEDTPYIQAYDLEGGFFFARMHGYSLKKLDDRPCIQTTYPDRIICGDSLIELSQKSRTLTQPEPDYISSNIFSTNVEKPILGFTNEHALVVYQADSSKHPERFQCGRLTFDSSLTASGCCLTITGRSTFDNYWTLTGSAASFVSWLLVYDTERSDIAYFECSEQSYPGQLAWSPTGQKIAYVREFLNENSEIAILEITDKPYFSQKINTQFDEPCSIENLKWENDTRISFNYKAEGKEIETRYVDIMED